MALVRMGSKSVTKGQILECMGNQGAMNLLHPSANTGASVCQTQQKEWQTGLHLWSYSPFPILYIGVP